MTPEMDKSLPKKAGHDTERPDSNYAMPEEMSAAFHKLIADRLLKLTAEVRRLGLDTGEEAEVDVGWESMPSAAREFHARSAENIAGQDEVEDRDSVVSDD